MRLVFVFATMVVAGPAAAGCTERPIGETLPAFRTALDARLASVDEHLAYLGGEPEAGAIYEARPSKAGVRLVTSDRLALKEIDTDVSDASDIADLDAMMTVAAFAVARLSAEPEAKVKDTLYGDLKQHSTPASWSRSWGGTVAVATKSERGLVFRLFKADCD